MNITDVRVRKVAKEGKMKAVVSITIDDVFVINDIKVIEGEKGYIHLDGAPNVCHNITLKTADKIESFDGEQHENRMTDEFIVFEKLYKENDLPACYYLLHHSQTVMQVLTQLRIDAGIKFASDS